MTNIRIIILIGIIILGYTIYERFISNLVNISAYCPSLNK